MNRSIIFSYVLLGGLLMSAHGAESTQWTKAITGVNLREQPIPSSPILARIPYNSRVIATVPDSSVPAATTSMRQVRWERHTGWVAAQYLADHDLGVSANDPFFSAAAACYEAMQKRLPLSPFVGTHGATYEYSSSLRCLGNSTGSARALTADQIDLPLRLTERSDGKGWEAGCHRAPSERTTIHDLRAIIPGILAGAGTPIFDHEKHTLVFLSGETTTLMLVFSQDGDRVVLSRIQHDITDPG